jgi:hypothetical protein
MFERERVMVNLKFTALRLKTKSLAVYNGACRILSQLENPSVSDEDFGCGISFLCEYLFPQAR